jgi:hypothetical protein
VKGRLVVPLKGIKKSGARLIRAEGNQPGHAVLSQKFGELLRGQAEVLLDGANPLFETLDSILNLTVRQLDERTGFPELLIQVHSIFGMAPVEVHLKSLGNELKFVPEFFG